VLYQEVLLQPVSLCKRDLPQQAQVLYT
jgi:hypothetical protein